MTRARAFLLVSAAIFLPLFAVPLFVDPIWWAERFGWDAEGPRDLGVYFGRCLGALALGLVGMALWAARDPAAYRWLFVLFAANGALLAIVHLRGTVEDSQPVIEHLETVGYAVVAIAALACMPRRQQQ